MNGAPQTHSSQTVLFMSSFHAESGKTCQSLEISAKKAMKITLQSENTIPSIKQSRKSINGNNVKSTSAKDATQEVSYNFRAIFEKLFLELVKLLTVLDETWK